MRVLFDIVHPAHVHFFQHLYKELLGDGHQVSVVSRDKEVTLQLLDHLGIPHLSTGSAVTGGTLARFSELIHRVRFIRRQIKQFEPTVVVTRNPSGVQAARLAGVPGIFDTDDGSAVGIHFWAARPFAHLIVTPACLREDFGRRHRRYPGFKALAYLHPNRFEPDEAVRDELGVSSQERLFLVRFSAHSASHDRDITGLTLESRRRLVALLADHGRVVVSQEGQIAEEFAPFAFSLPPDRFHHVLAAADLCLGDSQTVAAEAAILGTPAFRLSTFSGRVDYLRVLEERYGLMRNFTPGEEELFLREVVAAVDDLPSLQRQAAEGRQRLLAENVDVTSWYRELLDLLAEECSPGV